MADEGLGCLKLERKLRTENLSTQKFSSLQNFNKFSQNNFLTIQIFFKSI